MEMTSTVRRYTLEDFASISQDGFKYSISPTTHDIIHALAKEVGAPDYVRTPVFSSNRDKPRHAHRNRRKVQEISDEDWEGIRTFQSREKQEVSDTEKLSRSLRDMMNRVTVRDDIEETIINSLMQHVEQAFLINCSEELMEVFFTTLVSNPMNLGLYANAIGNLILNFSSEHSTVVRVIVEHLSKFINEWRSSYENISEVNEEDDFDLFCDLNKQNDLRVRKAKFLACLFDLLDYNNDEEYENNEHLKDLRSHILDVVSSLMCMFTDLLQSPNNIYKADQIGLSILELLANSDLGNTPLCGDGETATDIIQKILTDGRQVYPSLSNKLLFKLMY